NIPRSSFSTQQINTMFWFLKANGVSRVPCVRTLRSQNAALHNMCGIRTLEYDGVFGHKYFVNSLADIICQEMANPRVRPYLRFYPEDAGKTVNEYWHAAHWHEVADSSLVTPMAVIRDAGVRSRLGFGPEPHRTAPEVRFRFGSGSPSG
ncbi:hypothetical protein EDB83DRAFT_2236503, partial [Lactarius deliciosus]